MDGGVGAAGRGPGPILHVSAGAGGSLCPGAALRRAEARGAPALSGHLQEEQWAARDDGTGRGRGGG